MANLVRLKQIDQPELSGYIVEVTDNSFYPSSNPSGYISSVASDSNFVVLSGNLNATGYALDAKIGTTSGVLDLKISSTGSTLDSRITALSGSLLVTNSNLSIVSGVASAAASAVTGLEYETSGALSGEVAYLESEISGVSGVLNVKISTVSGNLSSRIASLESSFAATGGNFVDVSSNGQIISGTKEFRDRTSFRQINIKSYSGNYPNPGGQNQLIYTQITEDYPFYSSGNGNITGDLFVMKIMQPNNIEVIFSSMIYTGSY